MKISEIHNKDGSNEKSVSTLFSPTDNPRQLSMVDGIALNKARELPGLCTRRFDADVLTEGLDYKSLMQGSRLVIGDLEIEITAAGKRCYDECIIHQAGDTCPLPQNCAFARVIKGGLIEVGMPINHGNVEITE